MNRMNREPNLNELEPACTGNGLNRLPGSPFMKKILKIHSLNIFEPHREK